MKKDNKATPTRVNSFGFMDESGVLTRDKLFLLGLLKLRSSKELHRGIINLKNRYRFNKEYHFTEVDYTNLYYYKKLIDLYLNTKNTYFKTLVFDKNKVDIDKYHKANTNKAYNAFTARLITDALDEKGEYIAIIADDITTPKSDNFEKQIRQTIKHKMRRDALFGIIRAESHAFTELQMVDVLIGCISYAYKVERKIIPTPKRSAKLYLAKHLQKGLGIDKLAKSQELKLKGNRQFIIREFGKGIDD